MTFESAEMPDLIDFHPLLTQLQTRYPNSRLLTELLQIHDGSFVVRALVQVDELPLVTSMAAADTIEQAEDRARLRVLKLLGLGSALSASPIPAPPGYDDRLTPSSDFLNPGLRAESPGRSPLPASLPPLPDFQEFSSQTAPPGLDRPSEVSVPPDLTLENHSSPVESSFDRSPDLDPPSGANGKTRKRTEPKAAAKLPDPPPGEPIDLTPLFLQIEDEMERIGWTREQGRKHLMRVYNKKSRQQMTDDELMDFLAYLQVHPPAGEALFHS